MTLALPHFICRCCKPCPSARQRHRAFSTNPYNWSRARTASYYDLLGIKKDATAEEIKRAFFDKSKKLHPDSNPGNPDLHNQFVKLNEAYTVLSRERSRRQYDNMRTAWEARGPSPGRGGSFEEEPYGSPDFRMRSKTGPNMEKEYEEWVRRSYYRKPFTSEEAEKKRHENLKIVQYILLIMMGVTTLQFFAYKKFSEINARRLDEKNEYLNRIYNETKERARVKWKQRQMELLAQKQNRLVPRYYTRCEQFTAAAGPLGSLKGRSPPPLPTAK